MLPYAHAFGDTRRAICITNPVCILSQISKKKNEKNKDKKEEKNKEKNEKR